MTIKFNTLLTLAFLSFAFAAMPPVAEADDFRHPGISHTKEDFELVRKQIAAETSPWADAWARFEQSNYVDLSYSAQAHADVQRGPSNNPDIGSSEFSSDAVAAYSHALRYALTDDEAHAKKSAEIINAWSKTLKTITNHDARLLVGMAGISYCNAAEILKHEWDGWPQKDQDAFATMLRSIWYPIINDFYPSANGNWDASMIQTMAAMGVFLDDREMFQRAINYYRAGEGNGAIGNYFNEFGQCQETGRDQAHTQMGLEYLANTCVIAWNQGIDLYGELDNRLLLGFEYTAKYNVGFDVPYEPYRSFEGRYHYKRISDDSRGRLRPMYEKVYRHYHGELGLSTPYVLQALQKIRTGQAKSQGRRRRSGSSTLRWDTLMYASERLTPIDK